MIITASNAIMLKKQNLVTIHNVKFPTFASEFLHILC